MQGNIFRRLQSRIGDITTTEALDEGDEELLQIMEETWVLLHDVSLHAGLAQKSRLKAKIHLDLLVGMVGDVEPFQSHVECLVRPGHGKHMLYDVGSVEWRVSFPGTSHKVGSSSAKVYIRTEWGRVFFGTPENRTPLSNISEVAEAVRKQLGAKVQSAKRLKLEWDLLRWALHSPGTKDAVGAANGILTVFDHHGYGEGLVLNSVGTMLEVRHPNILGEEVGARLSFRPKGPHNKPAWCWNRVAAAEHIAKMVGSNRFVTRNSVSWFGCTRSMEEYAQDAHPF